MVLSVIYYLKCLTTLGALRIALFFSTGFVNSFVTFTEPSELIERRTFTASRNTP